MAKALWASTNVETWHTLRASYDAVVKAHAHDKLQDLDRSVGAAVSRGPQPLGVPALVPHGLQVVHHHHQMFTHTTADGTCATCAAPSWRATRPT